MPEYYKLPLRFQDILNKRELPKCRDLSESIGQNITLMLVSQFGEYRFDESFGCTVWDHDFENIFATGQWKEKIAGSIKEVIEKHEKRLVNVTVKTEIGQEEIGVKGPNHLQRIKRKLDVKVKANVENTNQPFEFTGKLYISPLSFD